MDIVYASLHRKALAEPPPSSEPAEVLGALWAHAIPDDGLEHASCRPEADRIDLLLYLLTRPEDTTDFRSPLHRAEALLSRSHQASPLLRDRYLPPHLTAA
ncbi:hypothetical protein [Streptacidiphilus jiangxiensis]|uniref:Uncharacterized protein n=1 Tax=Streptacidiphilus jiangxiensis TaxID=235985 RepID=A0A1H8AG25_STRJI|nr:hypothetical protein [Streptacidiphilus jiangxiensis]SEM68788.1 hypothetical protein SAMN05414137_1442 [Streptacidiphilus jiangxiensis]